jgi:hypothetical protein
MQPSIFVLCCAVLARTNLVMLVLWVGCGKLEMILSILFNANGCCDLLAQYSILLD